MIDQQYNKFLLICDNCWEESEQQFSTFVAAQKGKRQLGWGRQRAGKDWQDLCPNCCETEDPW